MSRKNHCVTWKIIQDIYQCFKTLFDTNDVLEGRISCLGDGFIYF